MAVPGGPQWQGYQFVGRCKLKKGVRIGIPRALLYYRYGSIWKELLRHAGFEVVVSPQTTEAIQNIGLSLSVADLCLPVKGFLGHVAILKDAVDALFIPRYISVEKSAYMCPKFIGLPDMARAAIRNIPRVIDPVMNNKTGRNIDFIYELNAQLSISNAGRDEQLRILDMPVEREYSFSEGAMTIALAGRPYLVLDTHMNKGIMRYLNTLGIKTVYYIPDLYSVEKTMLTLPKSVYWTLGKEVVTSVHTMLGNRDIDGIISLVNAGCGPDSFLGELINRSLDIRQKPYMSMTIDEHTSDAGLQTRLEAFVDMIAKRRPAPMRQGQ